MKVILIHMLTSPQADKTVIQIISFRKFQKMRMLKMKILILPDMKIKIESRKTKSVLETVQFKAFFSGKLS
jgi:hypothetical protein